MGFTKFHFRFETLTLLVIQIKLLLFYNNIIVCVVMQTKHDFGVIVVVIETCVRLPQ